MEDVKESQSEKNEYDQAEQIALQVLTLKTTETAKKEKR